MIILLLNGWANAKLAAASITTAIKHRAAIFMAEKYMQVRPQPTAITYHASRIPDHATLFDLRENVFHLVPAEGAQRLTLDVAERADFKHERAHGFVIWRVE